jgi:hypothetical protein
VRADGDADNDLDVDGNDLIVWQSQYGNVEELPPVSALSATQLTTEHEILTNDSRFSPFWLAPPNSRESVGDLAAVIADEYTEEIDSAFAELGDLPRGTIREFGEIAVRRGVQARVAISVEFASEF